MNIYVHKTQSWGRGKNNGWNDDIWVVEHQLLYWKFPLLRYKSELSGNRGISSPIYLIEKFAYSPFTECRD